MPCLDVIYVQIGTQESRLALEAGHLTRIDPLRYRVRWHDRWIKKRVFETRLLQHLIAYYYFFKEFWPLSVIFLDCQRLNNRY
jgi:hypothetical protein